MWYKNDRHTKSDIHTCMWYKHSHMVCLARGSIQMDTRGRSPPELWTWERFVEKGIPWRVEKYWNSLTATWKLGWQETQRKTGTLTRAEGPKDTRVSGLGQPDRCPPRLPEAAGDRAQPPGLTSTRLTSPVLNPENFTPVCQKIY